MHYRKMATSSRGQRLAAGCALLAALAVLAQLGAGAGAGATTHFRGRRLSASGAALGEGGAAEQPATVGELLLGMVSPQLSRVQAGNLGATTVPRPAAASTHGGSPGTVAGSGSGGLAAGFGGGAAPAFAPELTRALEQYLEVPTHSALHMCRPLHIALNT